MFCQMVVFLQNAPPHVDSFNHHKDKKIRHSGLKRVKHSGLATLVHALIWPPLKNYTCYWNPAQNKSVLVPVCWGPPAENCHFSMLGIKHFFLSHICFLSHPLPFIFSIPTSPSPPLPLVIFLFASALRGLREGRTTRATPFWQPPLRTAWNGAVLLCISFLWVGPVWRPVLKELLVPFERRGCMSTSQCAAAVYLYYIDC